MRLLFVHPGMTHNLRADLLPTMDRNRGPLPPLGLLYIMGAAEQMRRHVIHFIDIALDDLSDLELEEQVRTFGPDLAAITVNTFTLRDALLAARVIKRVAPSCRIVMGGPHCHMYPVETVSFPEVDYLILGEGEETFPELLRAIEFNKPVADVAGIAYKGEDGPKLAASRPNIADLDKLPQPPRMLTKYQKYASVLGQSAYMTTMMSSRGCPYSCSFCDRPIFARKYRSRSPENVLYELEACLDLGIREFQFYDDTFTVEKNRVARICELIIERKLDIIWDMRTRVDLVTPEMLRLLRKAGCIRIRYGVEASSDEVLKQLNKEITIPQVIDIFSETKRAGIETLAYFMIGSPGERREDVLTTVDFAKSLKPDYAVFSITSPYPHTPLYTRALMEGRLPRDVWQEFAADPFREDFTPPHWDEHFTPKELEELSAYAYRAFYFRPDYVLRRLARVRSLPDLGRKVKMAVSMIG